jgi:hypothetical protein
METQGKCPKCEGEMRPGFVVDRAHYWIGVLGEWAEGEPRTGWGAGLKLSGRKRYPLRGVRCERCGFVEVYALRAPLRT